MLLEGDLSETPIAKVRQLALAAWQDREKAHQFTMQVYRERLLQSAGRS